MYVCMCVATYLRTYVVTYQLTIWTSVLNIIKLLQVHTKMQTCTSVHHLNARFYLLQILTNVLTTMVDVNTFVITLVVVFTALVTLAIHWIRMATVAVVCIIIIRNSIQCCFINLLMNLYDIMYCTLCIIILLFYAYTWSKF